MSYSDDFFPFRTVLSLEPLIERWQALSEGDQPLKSGLAKQVLKQLESAPDLRGEIEDVSVFKQHRELVDLIMSLVLPAGMSDTTYAAAIQPWQPVSFYVTPSFEREDLMNHLLRFFEQKADFMSKGKAVNAYISLLDNFYSNCFGAKLPMFFPVINDSNGLTRYFKIDFDNRFCTVKNVGPVPELTDEDMSELMADVMNLELWREKLPPDNYEFRGFALLTALEVTEAQIVSILKNDLLQKDALSTSAKVEQVESRIRSLMRMPDLSVGLVSVERGEFNKITSIKPLGRSILLSKGVAPTCPMWDKSLYADVCDGRRDPVIMQDLKSYKNKTGFEVYLLEQGINNILLAPLYTKTIWSAFSK